MHYSTSKISTSKITLKWRLPKGIIWGAGKFNWQLLKTQFPNKAHLLRFANVTCMHAGPRDRERCTTERRGEIAYLWEVG